MSCATGTGAVAKGQRPVQRLPVREPIANPDIRQSAKFSPRPATSSSTPAKQRRISASRLGIDSALRNFALRPILGAPSVELLQMMPSNPLKVCGKLFFDTPRIPFTKLQE